MGLGKTIQMIAFLAGLKVSNLRSHVTRYTALLLYMYFWSCQGQLTVYIYMYYVTGTGLKTWTIRGSLAPARWVS